MFALLALIVTLFGGAQLQNENSNDEPYVVIYNIKDLEFVVRDFPDTPEIDLDSALNNKGGSPFRNPPQTQQTTKQNNAQEIMNLIQATIEPEAWGDTATMRYWNGNLIVKAPKRIHDQIE
jgi:hypothetical protein